MPPTAGMRKAMKKAYSRKRVSSTHTERKEEKKPKKVFRRRIKMFKLYE